MYPYGWYYQEYNLMVLPLNTFSFYLVEPPSVALLSDPDD